MAVAERNFNKLTSGAEGPSYGGRGVGVSRGVGAMAGGTYTTLTRIERHRAGPPRFVTPPLPTDGGTITREQYLAWEAETFPANVVRLSDYRRSKR